MTREQELESALYGILIDAFQCQQCEEPAVQHSDGLLACARHMVAEEDMHLQKVRIAAIKVARKLLTRKQ